jgi:hypothetical protein
MIDSKTEALIIRHIADLDVAARLMEEKIEPMLRKTVERIVQEWAESKQWSAKCDQDGEWDGSAYPLVWPTDWELRIKGSKETSQTATFKFGEMYAKQDAIGSYSYWTSMLCGVGGSVMIWWECDRAEYGYRKTGWKTLLAPHVQKLQQAGFSYSEEEARFGVTIRLTPEELARAVEEGAPEEALASPVKSALDLCLKAKPLFDKILAAAKQKASTLVQNSDVGRAAP